MIRGRFQTGLLAWGAQTTSGPRFAPLHSAFRRFCLSGVLPAAAFVFRRALRPARVDLIARNSVLDPGAFRMFESDLDLSLVFEEAAPIEVFVKGRELHARMKALLPFLGELEIYERREIRLKEGLVAAAGPVIDMLWQLRKWRWQYARLEDAPSVYHRRKAERAIRKIQARLGLANLELLPERRDGLLIGARIEELIRFLPRRDPCGPIAASAGFLEWDIRSSEDGGDPTPGFVLRCTGPGALALLSILPDGDSICPQERAQLADLRRSPAVSGILLAVALAEWTLIRSVERTNPGAKPEERELWRRRLETFFRLSPKSSLLNEFPEFAVGLR